MKVISAFYYVVLSCFLHAAEPEVQDEMKKQILAVPESVNFQDGKINIKIKYSGTKPILVDFDNLKVANYRAEGLAEIVWGVSGRRLYNFGETTFFILNGKGNREGYPSISRTVPVKFPLLKDEKWHNSKVSIKLWIMVRYDGLPLKKSCLISYPLELEFTSDGKTPTWKLIDRGIENPPKK